MNEDDIFEYVKLVARDINYYEVGPYLTSIAKELDNCTIQQLRHIKYIKSISHQENMRRILSYCSPIYKEFISIAYTFELFKKYTPVDVKVRFAKEYIDNFIGVKWNEEIGHMFDKDFKDMYNDYSSESFDDFCNAMSSMIYKALEDAEEIYNDIIQKKTTDVIQEKVMEKHYVKYPKKTHWYVEFYLKRNL